MDLTSKSLAFLLLVLALASANAFVTVDAATTSSPPGSVVWSNTFGGAGDEWAFSVIETSDGGYALAGYTNSSGEGNADAWLIKTDESGNRLWAKTYGGAGDDWASCIVEASDGGYVMAGSTNASGNKGYDFWLIKTDSDGKQLWSRTFGGTHNDYASCVVLTLDGGYAIAGITNSFGDGGYSLAGFRDVFIVGNADVWLVKTDASGKQQWNRTYGGANDDGAFSLAAADDGGYVLAGNTYSFSGGNNTDFWLLKTDALGNMLWNRTFGGAKDDFGYCVLQTSEGGYAFAGITNSSGCGYEDVWLIKTDDSGNLLWNRTYGGALNDESYCAIQTPDGGYALAGSTYAFGAGYWDAWLIKTDTEGNVLWRQTYGGVGDDQAVSAVLTSDGSFVMSGSTTTFGDGAWDAWLLKVSSVKVNGDTQTPRLTEEPSAPSPLVGLFPVCLGAAGVSVVVAVLCVAVYFRKRP
ncbi:MAG: hypothetical protein NWE93_06935 [Candidatus Bathyarchaeota archaeon]|nr:hypothetical protein [Candidatus Bathyarchaeota archaeon]